MKGETKLLALPFEPCRADMTKTFAKVEKAKYGGGTGVFNRNIRYYRVDVQDKILILTIYDTLTANVQYRCFISDYDYDYVSQRDDGKKSTQKPSNQYRYYRYWHSKDIFITDPESYKAAQSWLKICYEGKPMFERICKYVDNISEKKLEEKHRRIRESINDEMLQIKPLPKNFEKWVDDVPLKKCRYIIYKYNHGKPTTGFCTHCQNNVTVICARNRKTGLCPDCQSRVTYIASGKFSGEDHYQNAVYLQAGKNHSIIIRKFEVRRTVCRDLYDKPYRVTTRILETSRYFGERKIYAYGDHYYGNGTSSREWYRSGETGKQMADDAWVYSANLKRLFTKAYQHEPWYVLKYVPWNKLCRTMRFNMYGMIGAVKSYPCMESMIKLGMYKAAKDISDGDRVTYINKEFPNDICKFLGLYRKEFHFIIGKDWGMSEIHLYTQTRNSDDDSRLCIIDFERKYSCGKKLLEITQGRHIRRSADYIENMQADWPLYGCNNMSYKIRDYGDYLANARKIGWNMEDTKVLFPKNFKERHDTAADIVKLFGNQIQNSEIQMQYYSHIFDMYYEDDKYIATLPKNLYDLKYEGDNIHHCVYTNYAANVAEGESIIVFIRTKDKPYAPLTTAEIEPGTYDVIQIRADHNRTPDAEVLKFWEKYKKCVLEKLKNKKGTKAA